MVGLLLTCLQPCLHLIKGMIAIEKRQEQSLYSTTTREDMPGERRAQGVEERHHLGLVDPPAPVAVD